MVLVEVLNNFSANGSHLRSNASRLVDDLKFAPSVEIVKQTPELFERATALYAARAEKAWSLADCASFVIMTDMGIGEALTHDLHFEQAGFVAMMRG